MGTCGYSKEENPIQRIKRMPIAIRNRVFGNIERISFSAVRPFSCSACRSKSAREPVRQIALIFTHETASCLFHYLENRSSPKEYGHGKDSSDGQAFVAEGGWCGRKAPSGKLSFFRPFFRQVKNGHLSKNTTLKYLSAHRFCPRSPKSVKVLSFRMKGKSKKKSRTQEPGIACFVCVLLISETSPRPGRLRDGSWPGRPIPYG